MKMRKLAKTSHSLPVISLPISEHLDEFQFYIRYMVTYCKYDESCTGMIFMARHPIKTSIISQNMRANTE